MLVIFINLCENIFLALNRQHVKELTLESGRSRRDDDDDDNKDEGQAWSRSTTVRRTSLVVSRLVQLGGTLACQIGYGDDGTPKVGVFADLDGWIEKSLLTVFPRSPSPTTTVMYDSTDTNNETDKAQTSDTVIRSEDSPYQANGSHFLQTRTVATTPTSCLHNFGSQTRGARTTPV